METENTVTEMADAVQGEVVAAPSAEGGEAVRQEKAPFQTPAANKSFAKLRRERDRLARELAGVKAPEEVSESPAPSVPPAADTETADLRKERAYLRGLLFEGQFERDLQQLKGLFPLEKVSHVSELGEDFMALRAAGVDNIAAFVAVRLARNAGRPPEAGAVASAASEGGDFFTSREVDFLTEKELNDPKVLQKAIKSMTKWK